VSFPEVRNISQTKSMKRPNPILPAIAALLLVVSICAPAQEPGGPGGLRGGGRGGPGGPPLPAEEQAEVDRIMAALDAETKAVTAASSNLIAVTFNTPADQEKIGKANQELTKARSGWAAKASKLFVENQASEKKLSQEAIARLVQMSSGGRGGRGFGPGGPGGPGSPRRPPGQ